MARALTGWRNDWSAELGDAQLPLRPQLATTPATRPCSVRRVTGTTKTPCGCASAIRFTPRSSSPSCGATSSPASHPKRRSPHSKACTSAPATASARSSRRSCSTPTSTTAPSSSPRRSSTTPDCCARSRRPIDTTAWAWLSANAGQQLFYPPNVSGWDFSRWLDTSTAKARWEMASYVTSKTYPNPWPAKGEPEYSATEDPATALSSAMRVLGQPAALGRIRAVHHRLRPDLPERTAGAVGAAAPTGRCARTRCGC